MKDIKKLVLNNLKLSTLIATNNSILNKWPKESVSVFIDSQNN